jgi:hypothetical protein
VQRLWRAKAAPAAPVAPAAAMLVPPFVSLFVSLFVFAAALASAPARASLGEKTDSVEADRLQLRAVTHVRSMPVYAVHELSGPGGDVVREYVSSSGVVFAVSWVGKTLPNLRQLLGAHFETYTGSPHRSRGGNGHLVVRDGELTVESTGRMRSFRGHAYLSNAIPAGVNLHDIQ